MLKKKPKLDVTQNAVLVAGEAVKRHERSLPDGLQTAWQQWAGVGKVDQRMILLRAAFEAGGAEAGKAAHKNVPTRTPKVTQKFCSLFGLNMGCGKFLFFLTSFLGLDNLKVNAA
jgi:hypothetical protein